MSKEIAKQFLCEYSDNEEAMNLLNEYPQPKSQGEAIAQLAEVAMKMGKKITAEELTEAIHALRKEQKTRTDAAASEMEALEDDDLEDVAGGIYTITNADTGERKYECYHESNITCKLQDACSLFNNVYYDCQGDYYKEGEEFSCEFQQYWCTTGVDAPPGVYNKYVESLKSK